MRPTGVNARPNLLPRLCLRLALVVACALCSGVSHGQADDVTPSQWRLRVAWGGGEPIRWQVRASLSEGKLQDLRLLGRQRDTPGSIWLAEGRVEGSQPRPRAFDGFDITAAASRDATLRIELREPGVSNSHVIEASIAQLLKDQQRLTLDPTGNTLLVHRASDDALRIDLQHQGLIFAPGETLRFMVEPMIADVAPGSSLDLAVEIVEGRDGRSKINQTQRVALPARGSSPVPWSLPLPVEPGIYTVRITARHPPGNRVAFWNNANRQEALAQRSFQVLVFDPEPVTRFADPEWSTLTEIDPANPRWWNRLPEWSRLGRFAGGTNAPSGSQPFRTSDYRGTTLAELPASTGDEPSWQAYPLPGAQPGEPHLLEIDLPGDVPLDMALRVYEQGADGELHDTDTDRGITIDRWVPSSSDQRLVTHRMLFWPRTDTPVLVLQNAHTSKACQYGPIRLRHASPKPSRPPDTDSAVEHPVLARFSWDGLLARMAVGQNEPGGRPQIDDLKTFHDAAVRLADFCELGGYNGAVVTILADGGAAARVADYPLAPRLNSSPLSSGTTDLPDVDPLRVLLEVFGQRGLTLTPSLCFNGSLPPLEAERRRATSDGSWAGVVADSTGRPRTLSSLEGVPGPPHYSFRDGQLTQEIIAIVDALIARYGGQPAFRGLAFELSADSYLVLPPLYYDLTPERIESFAKAIDATEAQRQSWLEDSRKLLADPAVRSQLLAWRTTDLSAMWQTIATRLADCRQETSLWLLSDELFASREYQVPVRPRMLGVSRLEELYLERGIDLETLAANPHIEIPGVFIETAALPLSDAAIPMHLNQLALRAETFSQRGLMLAKRPRWLPEPPVAGQSTSALRPVVFDRLGAADFRYLLAGWRYTTGPIILGSEQGPSTDPVTSRPFLKAAARLASRSVAEVRSDQPLAAFLGRTADQTRLSLTNPTPWPVTATLSLEMPQKSAAESHVPGQASTKLEYAQGRNSWTVTLPPYGIHGLEIGDPKVNVAGIFRRESAEITQSLQSRLTDLERRDLAARQPYLGLANASFEQLDEQGKPIGWRVEGREPPAVSSRPSVSPGFRDKHALRLFSSGSRVSLVSDPFAAPPTGQLAMVAYIRPESIASESELRMIIEEVDAQSLPRSITVTAAMLQEQDSKEWTGYRFGVEDLPLDSQARLQVTLELAGAGDIAIDAIELYQVVFPLELYQRDSEYKRLAIAQRIESARMALEQQRYTDCLWEIESYWARFLIEYLPPMAKLPAQVASPSGDEGAEPPPTRVGDRLRQWFRL